MMTDGITAQGAAGQPGGGASRIYMDGADLLIAKDNLERHPESTAGLPHDNAGGLDRIAGIGQRNGHRDLLTHAQAAGGFQKHAVGAQVVDAVAEFRAAGLAIRHQRKVGQKPLAGFSAAVESVILMKAILRRHVVDSPSAQDCRRFPILATGYTDRRPDVFFSTSGRLRPLHGWPTMSPDRPCKKDAKRCDCKNCLSFQLVVSLQHLPARGTIGNRVAIHGKIVSQSTTHQFVHHVILAITICGGGTTGNL